VLVLDGGRVLEQGTPAELLAARGRFAAAWRRQSEARALESEPRTEAPR
jgi:ABC-type multidrug transport system fused ATPase/permease subunit